MGTMNKRIDIDQYRRPAQPIEPLLYRRWSPRAMSGESIAPGDLACLFEAARWAPSCFNDQPWRFVFAHRESSRWPAFFDLLVEGNRRWAQRAGVLIVVVSRETFARNGEPSRTHSFDAGAAWQNLALQGSAMGLVVHGMAGFDRDAARAVIELPVGYRVEAMIAVGKPGRAEELDERLREREVPSSRLAIEELAFEGRFPPG
jgi:nitroreductase